MSGPTPDELEKLKRELKDASLREKRPSGSHARGLEQLMAAEAAAPPSTSGSKRRVLIGGGAVVAALLLAWGLSRDGTTPAVQPLRVDAGSAPVVMATPVDAGVPAQTEPVVSDAGAAVALVVEADAGALTVDAGRASKPVRAPVEDPDLLARELALLDRARSTLRTDPKQTLVTLTEYLAKFPSGALKNEAALIRVEALLAVGRVADAQRLANQLIAADKDGLIKKRLNRLLDAGQ